MNEQSLEFIIYSLIFCWTSVSILGAFWIGGYFYKFFMSGLPQKEKPFFYVSIYCSLSYGIQYLITNTDIKLILNIPARFVEFCFGAYIVYNIFKFLFSFYRNHYNE